ncbi:HAD-IIB family hydrolase [Octadecabacter sp. 1_MG-2023]|uniref:HAD-IIB family hydrolase n=1 Tax=unclassified Octadecabacter TaxID=196158 RepID=UPI002091DE33|nr:MULTISPECIES: HAD-IIB family hydrolase [unclassified Octadecabacter]MDO6735043.1 HAD-IIB family hydrolase [Octadecabacter sp. 1_MG-2023]
MKSNTQLIVFTDLDGTLIDHETYRWDAAQPALTVLNQISAGVVLASSKTTPEIATLRTSLGLDDWPAIVENGAGILPPNETATPGGASYAAVREALNRAPEDLRGLFRGFGDVTTTQVAEMTGLSQTDAALAQQRAFSEPGQWLGTDVQKVAFVDHLKKDGIIAQQGGRFLTLSFGGNKVDQMRTIIDAYKPQHTIALGDAPNDIQMLENADYGVVVANPNRAPLPPLSGEEAGQIIRTVSAGPTGWAEAVLSLLHKLELH